MKQEELKQKVKDALGASRQRERVAWDAGLGVSVAMEKQRQETLKWLLGLMEDGN